MYFAIKKPKPTDKATWTDLHVETRKVIDMLRIEGSIVNYDPAEQYLQHRDLPRITALARMIKAVEKNPDYFKGSEERLEHCNELDRILGTIVLERSKKNN